MKKLIIVLLFILTLFSTSCGQPVIEVEEEISPNNNDTPIIEEPIIIEPVIEQELNEGLDGLEVKKRKVKPAQTKPNLVDFDAYFTTIAVDHTQMQSSLDQGYIIYYNGDYFHHNTSKFLNIFWQCTEGVQVKIYGQIYTSGGIYHGYVDSGIWYDNGDPSWYKNSITELITCDGGHGTQLRWILRLY